MGYPENCNSEIGVEGNDIREKVAKLCFSDRTKRQGRIEVNKCFSFKNGFRNSCLRNIT